jgi:acetyl-CoA acetyltransferase
MVRKRTLRDPLTQYNNNVLLPDKKCVTINLAEIEIMGIGPVPAIKMALERAGKNLDEIDLVEVNEAFACQYLAVEKELGLDRQKANVNGGAIAIGHPLAATGGRITATLIHELKRRNVRYGLGSACIGGGQGIALLLERI